MVISRIVAAQVAACVVLVSGGTLLVRTLANLRAVDRGFQADNLLLLEIGGSQASVEGDRVAPFYQDILSRTGGTAGLAAVSLAARPVFGRDWQKLIWTDGLAAGEAHATAFNVVAPGFFAATGTRLLAGRDFTAGDRLGSAAVVVVNETFARRYCLQAIGCRFGDRRSAASQYEVIGVVEDARYGTLRQDTGPMIYHALLQETFASSITLHARTRTNPRHLVAPLQGPVRGVDPTLPVYDARTAVEQIERSLREERLMAALSSFFAVVAMLVTCIGLFGTIAWAVRRRAREIGVRIALGARPSQVLRAVVGETMRLVAAGAMLGVLLSLAGTRVLGRFLFGLSPTDPAALGASAVLLLAVAATAAYLPARRAATIDPMLALRHD